MTKQEQIKQLEEQIRKLQEEATQEILGLRKEKLLHKWIVMDYSNYRIYAFVQSVNENSFEVSQIEKYKEGSVNADVWNTEMYYEDEDEYEVITEEEVRKQLMNGLDKWVDSMMEACK